jgi:hypothetical protein
MPVPVFFRLCVLLYGALGFLYSFLVYLTQQKNIISLKPFRLITVQEIEDHFIFGFIVSIKAFILIGLMALTIDYDHILNIAFYSFCYGVFNFNGVL